MGTVPMPIRVTRNLVRPKSTTAVGSRVCDCMLPMIDSWRPSPPPLQSGGKQLLLLGLGEPGAVAFRIPAAAMHERDLDARIVQHAYHVSGVATSSPSR